MPRLQTLTLEAVKNQGFCESRYGWINDEVFHYVDELFYVDDYESDEEFIEDVLCSVVYFQ